MGRCRRYSSGKRHALKRVGRVVPRSQNQDGPHGWKFPPLKPKNGLNGAPGRIAMSGAYGGTKVPPLQKCDLFRDSLKLEVVTYPNIQHAIDRRSFQRSRLGWRRAGQIYPSPNTLILDKQSKPVLPNKGSSYLEIKCPTRIHSPGFRGARFLCGTCNKAWPNSQIRIPHPPRG